VKDNAESFTTYSWDIENAWPRWNCPPGALNAISYDGDGKRRRHDDSQDAFLRSSIWEDILLQIDVNNVIGRDCPQNLRVRGEPVGHYPAPAADHQDQNARRLRNIGRDGAPRDKLGHGTLVLRAARGPREGRPRLPDSCSGQPRSLRQVEALLAQGDAERTAYPGTVGV
jgi:hypothetical protein